MPTNAHSEPEPGGTKFEAPVRLVSSHNVANPGFQSHTKGEFWCQGQHLAVSPFHQEDVRVIGVDLRSISLSHRQGDWFVITVEFIGRMDIDRVEQFLSELAEAYTVGMAHGQKNAWYGNLIFEVGISGLRDISPKPAGVVNFETSVDFASIQNVPVSKRIIENLRWSPLVSIFSQGMRAPHPKSKFLFWFVVLEELEKREEFASLFTPLFSNEEKEQLLAATESREGRGRINGIINSAASTREARHQKLLRILQEIGLGNVTDPASGKSIDEGMCKSLIKQRNNVAHRGAVIDENLLYSVLFPLAQGALSYIEGKETERQVVA